MIARKQDMEYHLENMEGIGHIILFIFISYLRTAYHTTPWETVPGVTT